MATARIPETTRDFESLNDDEMYARALASDASYNGRFFIGVLTTGIYCLPSCHARKPFRRNVRFFPDVESARTTGLRACKKCYPDDFALGLDPLLDQVDALAAEVRADPASFPDVAALVKRSGYGTTRLYQLFSLRYNLDPGRVPHRNPAGPRQAPAGRNGRYGHRNRLRGRLLVADGLPSELQTPHRPDAGGLQTHLRTQAQPRRRKVTKGPRNERIRHLRHAPGRLHRRRQRHRRRCRHRIRRCRRAVPFTRLHLDDLTHDPERVAHVRAQIEQYFNGTRQEFDLTLAPSGTPFQHSVWQALRDIPFNQTRSYGQLATMLGTSPRAMGGANGSNRICLIVPCHRVIGSDGSLTGFAYGTEVKRRLLEHEARVAAGVQDSSRFVR